MTVNNELKGVEAIIKDKLDAFSEEVAVDNTEKKTIEERQEEIKQKLNLLDEQDAKIERDMEGQKATQQSNEQDLEHLITQKKKANERVESSKTEQSILKDLSSSMIQNRDTMVAQHKAEIKR